MNTKKKLATTIVVITMVAISLFFIIPKLQSSPLDKSIIKQFVYNIDPTYPPINGLQVDLYNSDLLPVGTQFTDATGYVTFAQLTDQTYTLKWMWGGVEDQHQELIDCTKIVWDLGTNYLESKSGGGLHSAEPVR